MTVAPKNPNPTKGLAQGTAIRAVLFDRDDTIAYTDRNVYQEAAIWVAKNYGLEPRFVGEALMRQWIERGMKWWDIRSHQDEAEFWNLYGLELMQKLGLRPDDAPAFMEVFPYERYMKPVHNARQVLSTLKNRGIKIGVLSNTLPSVNRTLQAVGLADLIDVALSTCLIGTHKPEAGAFEYALAELGFDAPQVLFVDDKQENIDAAQALGMPATLIDLTGKDRGAIHDLSDVLKWVDAS